MQHYVPINKRSCLNRLLRAEGQWWDPSFTPRSHLHEAAQSTLTLLVKSLWWNRASISMRPSQHCPSRDFVHPSSTATIRSPPKKTTVPNHKHPIKANAARKVCTAIASRTLAANYNTVPAIVYSWDTRGLSLHVTRERERERERELQQRLPLANNQSGTFYGECQVFPSTVRCTLRCMLISTPDTFSNVVHAAMHYYYCTTTTSTTPLYWKFYEMVYWVLITEMDHDMKPSHISNTFLTFPNRNYKINKKMTQIIWVELHVYFN